MNSYKFTGGSTATTTTVTTNCHSDGISWPYRSHRFCIFPEMNSSDAAPTTESWDGNGTAADVDGVRPWSTWRQPWYGVAVLAVAYAAVAVVGVLNNALVVAAVFYHSSMRTVTNYFLANLAVADILVCVFVLPVTLLHNILTGNAITASLHAFQTKEDTKHMAIIPSIRYDTIRYDTRCYFNVRSKADMSRLNLPHGDDN